MGAPVIMRTALPAATLGASGGSAPAAMVPTTSNVTGVSGEASAVSLDSTAKPSIAVLSHAGTGSGETAGSAVTSPEASSNGICAA